MFVHKSPGVVRGSISPTCFLLFCDLAVKWRFHLRRRVALAGVSVAGAHKRLSKFTPELDLEDILIEYINWSHCKNGIDGPRTNDERMAWPRHVWSKF